MNKTKLHFSVTEWFSGYNDRQAEAFGEIPHRDLMEIIRKIETWISYMNPVRIKFGKPIVVTHGLRIGNGSSAHFFLGDGATDCRPSLRGDGYWERFAQLGTILTSDFKYARRITLYPPGKLFPNGAYHLDRRSAIRKVLISDPDKVNWRTVTMSEFTSVLNNLKNNNNGRDNIPG